MASPSREQAREMLKTGNYPVKLAGVTIGFSNLSNFAKKMSVFPVPD
jgi:hypothetical protein